jgi:hypothetical protein
MSRRIDIELTSTRPDGSWTWRAAGAKQPKGEVPGTVLPAGAKVGDVLRVEVESYLDGLTVTSVLPTRGARPEPARIEIVGTRRNDELVTTTLVERRGRRDGDRRDGDRRDRGPRGDRPEGDRRPRGDRPEGDRGPRGERRPAGERGPRPDRPERRGPRPDGAPGPRAPRRERPAPPPAPKAVRLRPGRTHRNAVLGDLPVEQKPIAEQILRGGLPAVRQAIEKQNELARADGQPEIRPDSLLAFAEQLLPRLRAAEWRDKAEAALAGIDEVDLRDIRTVVVAADAAARDDETKALAQQLRDGLSARVEGEHAKWISELTELVGEGRTVRALRLSSRPPKAGAPLPAELADRLAESAGTALAGDITQDRWATLVDAVAFSPVRLSVRPAGIPATVSDELQATIVRVGARVPQIASLFGITPAESAPARRGPAGGRTRPPGGAPGGVRPAPAAGRTGAIPPAPAPVETAQAAAGEIVDAVVDSPPAEPAAAEPAATVDAVVDPPPAEPAAIVDAVVDSPPAEPAAADEA